MWSYRLVGPLTCGMESVGACWLEALAKAHVTHKKVGSSLFIFLDFFGVDSLIFFNFSSILKKLDLDFILFF